MKHGRDDVEDFEDVSGTLCCPPSVLFTAQRAKLSHVFNGQNYLQLLHGFHCLWHHSNLFMQAHLAHQDGHVPEGVCTLYVNSYTSVVNPLRTYIHTYIHTCGVWGHALPGNFLLDPVLKPILGAWHCQRLQIREWRGEEKVGGCALDTDGYTTTFIFCAPDSRWTRRR